MSLVVPPLKFAWKTYSEYQDKNPPVQNTEYTVFDETGGVQLVSIALLESNTETNNKEIDCIITMDGITWTYDASSIGMLIHNQVGSFFMVTGTTATGVSMIVDLIQNVTLPHDFIRTKEGGKPLAGHAIKVVLKMTSAAGTAQRLKYHCVYKKLEAV